MRVGELSTYLSGWTYLHSLCVGRCLSNFLGPVGRPRYIGDGWSSHGRGHDELWKMTLVSPGHRTSFEAEGKLVGTRDRSAQSSVTSPALPELRLAIRLI
jgi:hypothetical protein